MKSTSEKKTKRIGITMRVAVDALSQEPRDCLAQNWPTFLNAWARGNDWVLLPNIGAKIIQYAQQMAVDALILTGGNDIGECGIRDETELSLLDDALKNDKPVLGVCRGMQLIAHYYGAKLTRIPNDTHLRTRHAVDLSAAPWGGHAGSIDVNSTHRFGIQLSQCPQQVRPFAKAAPNWVEGFYHPTQRLAAVMWHPERESSVTPHDRDLMNWLFSDDNIN